MTALLEYLDLDCSIRVYRSFKQVFKDPFQAGSKGKMPQLLPTVGGPAHMRCFCRPGHDSTVYSRKHEGLSFSCQPHNTFMAPWQHWLRYKSAFSMT